MAVGAIVPAGRVEVLGEVNRRRRAVSVELVGTMLAAWVDGALGTDAANTRAAYAADVVEFMRWHDEAGGGPVTRAAVAAWAGAMLDAGLARSTVNRRLSAVRRIVREAAAAGLLDDDTARAIAGVKGVKVTGARAGRWLGKDAALALLHAPDVRRMSGRRDRAMLALLLGGGLRRDELARLEVDQVRQVAGRWAIVDLEGKGGRLRTVPIPSWCYVAVREWMDAAGITDGHIMRPVNRGGRVVGESMTASAIWYRVRLYASRLADAGVPASVDEAGRPDLDTWRAFSAHDARRTFAKLAYAGGAPLDQVQLSLGHASIRTTERYLGVEQNMHDAPCDRLGISVGG